MTLRSCQGHHAQANRLKFYLHSLCFAEPIVREPSAPSHLSGLQSSPAMESKK